jgi:hypothetical protein
MVSDLHNIHPFLYNNIIIGSAGIVHEREKGRGLNKFLLAWAAADERMIGAAGIQGGGRSEQDGIHSTQGWARGSLLHHQGLCVLEREGERERRERLGVGRPLVRYHPIVQSWSHVATVGFIPRRSPPGGYSARVKGVDP